MELEPSAAAFRNITGCGSSENLSYLFLDDNDSYYIPPTLQSIINIIIIYTIKIFNIANLLA